MVFVAEGAAAARAAKLFKDGIASRSGMVCLSGRGKRNWAKEIAISDLLRGGARNSGLEQSLLTGSLKKTIGQATLPALAICASLWIVLAWNIWATTGISEPQQIAAQLKEHRREKAGFFRKSIFPLFFTSVTIALYAYYDSAKSAFWYQHGPSPTALGLNFAYWAAEIMMDTALDECGILQLRASMVTSIVAQLPLIALLTTRTQYGHMIFWLKAVETLLATCLAKLIDHPLWIGIALLSTSFGVAMSGLGRLAPLPPGVSRTGAGAYFLATFFATTFYQLVQNYRDDTWVQSLIGNIQLVRAILCCGAIGLFGTPPSWALYDALNFSMFFGLKVVTDSIALAALSEEAKHTA